MILETDLSDRAILDFGCNQGGFLRFLYSQRPFKRGVGVDLARALLAAANGTPHW
jgi:predicted rRNA methylase YqxC with S4 and FtsJ domains